MLEDHADFAGGPRRFFQVRGQFHAINKISPGLMLFQTIDASDHRRFARPGRPANDDTFLAHDLEVDVAQNMKIAVPLVELDEFNRNGGLSLAGLSSDPWLSKMSFTVDRPSSVEFPWRARIATCRNKRPDRR